MGQYWKLRHLERALLKNMHVDKRLASTAFIVDIWGKGMIMLTLTFRDCCFFNTNQCEDHVPSDWRKTPAFDSQRRLLSSCIMFFLPHCSIRSNASLRPHRRKQVTRPSLANEGPTLGAPKNFPRKKRPCPSPPNTNHVFRRYFRWLCVKIRVWIGPRWSRRLDRSGSPAFWYGSGVWIGLWVQGMDRAFTFWLMLLLGQQDHETSFSPSLANFTDIRFFSRLRGVNFAIVTRISRPNVGNSWQFHCFSLWEGSRSFGDFTVIWKYFKSTSFYDAKNYIISTTIAYNVQPHVTHSTATDNRWLVKAAQKHCSVSNRTFALHTSSI